MIKIKKEKKGEKKLGDDWEVTNCKYYKENYGRFMSWGMLLRMSYSQSILYSIVLILHIPILGYSSVLLFEEEFADFTEVIHFCVLLVLSLSAAMILSFSKMFDNGLHDYGNTLDEKTASEIREVSEGIRKRKFFRSQFMIYGLSLASFTVLCRPAYEWAIGTFDVPNYKHNINRMVPVKLYYFLDVSYVHTTVIMYIVEYYIIIQTTFLVIASSTTFISTSEELCVELATLNMTIRNLVRRAKFTNDGKVEKKVLLDCLKRCVIHHLNIIKCFKAFQKLYYWILWLIFTISTYMMCLCGFLMTMENVEMKLTNRITSIFFLVLETFHLLIYCWYGEEIQTRSAQIHSEIYNSDWINHSAILKNSINIIQLRTLQPLKMSCGGLMFANLNTFSNVVNTAYSYFNLLKASN